MIHGSTQPDPVLGAQECARQIGSAEDELARLQGLLDDTMSRLLGAFQTLSHGAEMQREEKARDVLVTTLQFHDVCGQVLTHARGRLAAGRALAEQASGLSSPFQGAGPGRAPALHTDMAPGTVELF